MKLDGICQDESRRLEVRRQGLNGIDYVEIEHAPDASAPPTLVIYFFGSAPDALTADHIAIEGGTRITGVKVTDVQLCKTTDAEHDDCARARVDKEGDRSTYTVSIVGLEGFDPIYSRFDFIFQPDCPGDLDCLDEPPCAAPQRDEPEIDYLAKDYQGFRRLILDRWALIMPAWKERHVPDLGIALAEVLAYVGDHLSYYQDAVATEAYLGTARQRVSLRRHARLVDYDVHEGSNARALVCVETASDMTEIDPGDVFFITRCSSVPDDRVVLPEHAVPAAGYEVFEPVATRSVRFYKALNRIDFHTWGNAQCWLPKGATSATLKDGPVEPEPPPADPPAQYGQAVSDQSASDTKKKPKSTSYGAKLASTTADVTRTAEPRKSGYEDAPRPPTRNPPRTTGRVEPGQLLVFVEVKGPITGDEADADPLHRHSVRITRVERTIDPLSRQRVVNIWWDPADALPFPLCLSSLGRPSECPAIEGVSVARGNILLVDHGRRIDNDPLDGFVPAEESAARCLGVGRPAERIRSAGAFRPVLARGPLTFAAPVREQAPASKLFEQNPGEALPSIRLTPVTLTGVWDVSRRTADESQPAGHEHSSTKGKKDNPDSAIFIFDQIGEGLDGSCAGAFGPFNVCGTVHGRQISFRQIPPPQNGEPVRPVTFTATLVEGVLEGTFHGPDASGTFHATKRHKDPVWTPRRDLLSSGPRDAHFVVEMDNDGMAQLRFGDGENGLAPDAGDAFHATYRVGSGHSGNVGTGAIAHMVLRRTLDGLEILAVTNPLPASGGTAPETFADIKLLAPSVFRRRLERAITADDYATLAQRHPQVQRAAATLRFTGIRYSVQVAIDPFGVERLDPALLDEIKASLYRYRRIGHDLEVVPARYVPLDIEMTICVRRGFIAAHVKSAILEVLGTGVLRNGGLGFFHPDNLTFGTAIRLSAVVGAVQAVDGVESVAMNKLERLWLGRNPEIENGTLPIGTLEIARLHNDPNYPENGTLRLTMGGER